MVKGVVNMVFVSSVVKRCGKNDEIEKRFEFYLFSTNLTFLLALSIFFSALGYPG